MQTADFTIADVLAWARTKPADEAYDFQFTGGCALCQFLNESGRASKAYVLYRSWADDAGAAKGLIDDDFNDALGCGFPKNAWTFGELVKRLEKLCPETPVTRENWQGIDAYLTDIEDVARERCSA